MKKPSLYILNGPNLNLLGMREPGHYGTTSYRTLVSEWKQKARASGARAVIFQSNHEGALVDKIQEAYRRGASGIVINPGAYTHTSIALLDAVRAVRLPVVEVHISDVNAREEFRKVSYIRAACVHTICAHGTAGYTEAMEYLLRYIREKARADTSAQNGRDTQS